MQIFIEDRGQSIGELPALIHGDAALFFIKERPASHQPCWYCRSAATNRQNIRQTDIKTSIGKQSTPGGLFWFLLSAFCLSDREIEAMWYTQIGKIPIISYGCASTRHQDEGMIVWSILLFWVGRDAI